VSALDLPLFSYDLVMIDPPWPWDIWSEKGEAKSPTAQYGTMSFDEIGALRVGDLLAPGGVVFLWCTWPLLVTGQQVETLRRWGLTPRTGGAWAKRTASGRLRWGTGYLIRSCCEPFVIATLADARFRGSSLPNLIETVEDAVLDGVAREHSRKPDEVYRLLEAVTPGRRRADVFARQRRPGWDGWGNELGKFDEVIA
jgi:N6-adenosine-specific RNA methylase IME4